MPVGDRLARGDRSAQFPSAKFDGDITIPHTKQVFCECRDCPLTFYSAVEFSAHVDDCNAAKAAQIPQYTDFRGTEALR